MIRQRIHFFRLARFVAVIFGLLFSTACALQHMPDGALGADSSYAFVNVNILDVENERVVPGQTVLVDSGVIKMISAEIGTLPEGVFVIDGKGKFLAPGLADMHVHVWDDSEPAIYVAFGVTTIRNMWGTGKTKEIIRKINNKEIIGARIITSGPIIDGVPEIWPGSRSVARAADAIDEVRKQAAAGYDFIKVYSNLSPESFSAIAEAAHDIGIPFSGHIPEAIPVNVAITSGMASIEHLYGLDKAVSNVDLGPGRRISLERFVVGRRILSGQIEQEEVFPYEKSLAIAQSIKNADVAVTPTLIVRRRVSPSREESRRQLARDEIGLIRPSLRESWDLDRVYASQGLSDSEVPALRVFEKFSDELVRIMNEEGVLLLAGSDAQNHYVFHGLSLHEELELLVNAGLSTFESIRTATINAAIFLGESGEWGVVKEGARSDLVLLNSDPSVNISNYQDIAGVMVGDVWLDTTRISMIKRDIASSMN